MSLLRVIRHTSAEWCQETSIAGLGKTVKSDSSYFKKAYWFILFLIGSIWTCYNLYGVINKYLKYSVSTSSDLTFETSIPFPAVTICNQNRFDFLQHYLFTKKLLLLFVLLKSPVFSKIHLTCLGINFYYFCF